jgi:DNA-binding MarR family transcriptional regulator
MREFDAQLDVVEHLVALHLASRLGVSRTDARALEIIERQRGMTPGELARDLGYTASAVTVVINRLEAAGLVSRRLSATDRRRLALFTTDEGEELVRRFFTGLAGRMAFVLEGMADSDLVAVERFLRECGAKAAEYRRELRHPPQQPRAATPVAPGPRLSR